MKSGKKTVTVLIILLVILVLLAGGLLYYFLAIKPAQKPQVKGGQREAAALQGSLNQMTEEEIKQALDNIVEEGAFRISIASNIIVEEDGPAQLRIENNIQNRYVMQVTLYVKEKDEKTGEETQREVYSTALIDPGYYIQSANLDQHLDPGEYEGLAVFTALYSDTEEIVGTAGAEVKLHVFAKEPTPTPEPTSTPEPAVEGE